MITRETLLVDNNGQSTPHISHTLRSCHHPSHILQSHVIRDERSVQFMKMIGRSLL